MYESFDECATFDRTFYDALCEALGLPTLTRTQLADMGAIDYGDPVKHRAGFCGPWPDGSLVRGRRP